MAQKYEKILRDYDISTDDADLTNMQHLQIIFKSLSLKKYKLDLYFTSNIDTKLDSRSLESPLIEKIR
jgi:hypothetical protein